ncbi:DUF5686 family protein [Parabacteroides sp. OttesenSCG-928-G06]|nr:DUF5686 family protein [Parabacteroides sp. OttesenSCG-928-G06]
MSFANATPQSRHQADSIMQYVIEEAALYANAVSHYKANIYIKGRSEILRKNWLIQYAHHLVPVDRRKPDVIYEMVSESEYEAPNLYHHNFKAVNGNAVPNSQKQREILTFLNINVYSPSIYEEAIITPVGSKAFHYYEFNMEEIKEVDEGYIYKIRYLPKHRSQNLVSGDLYIRSDAWRIEKIDMHGRHAFAEFNLTMTFGHEFGQLILPNKADLSLRYQLLGNTIQAYYHSAFDYTTVSWIKNEEKPKNAKREWKSLDLTKYYTLSSDSIPFVQEESYWAEKRDEPLSAEEKETYEINYIKAAGKSKDSTKVDYLKLTERLSSTVNYNIHSTRIRYSGILNPFQLGYSSNSGLSYRQQIRISKTFNNDRQLIIRPEVGYLFKRKEFFFKFLNEMHYLPEKKGYVQLTIANDNQTYSSRMKQEINEHLKDSLFDFNDLNLDYYRHYYVDLRNNIELSNGLELYAGVSYHRRDPIKKKKLNIDPGDNVEELIDETFYDFTPVIGLTYTPRQFYRMNGMKKEYVRSYYPTMSIELAKGIPGVLSSMGNYTRLEADIHQSLKLGLLKRFNYHVSAGMFTQKDASLYFADFQYFSRRNFPESWDERIGGVFHTLRREWFNASDKYVQAHMMYESPFILMNLINNKASKHVVSERLYLGHLWTPALRSYTEVGYGIGNDIFNIALFAGFKKTEFERFGVRFTFEIE